MITIDSVLSITPTESRDSLSADEFKAAFRNHPAGVAVVTADAGEGPVAMTVTSVFSISAVPPLLVFSCSALSSSTAAISSAGTLVVHLLAADQLDLAVLGATSGIDRFDGSIPWSRLPGGEPYYLGAQTTLRGRVVARLAAGASTLVVVEAIEVITVDAAAGAQDGQPGRPLVYHNRTWHALGEQSAIPAESERAAS